MSERMNWLDFLKGIAIIAVMFDHEYTTIFKGKVTDLVHLHASFAVGLFILVAGITSGMSLSKLEKVTFTYVLKRVGDIYLPMVLSTAIVQLLYHDGRFDYHKFFLDIQTFQGDGPYYFVAFFIQLILISPLLYFCIRKWDNYFAHAIFLVLLYGFSQYSVAYTYISDLYGGGKYVLGGTFLFIFGLGMLFFHYRNRINKKGNVLMFIVGIVLLIILEITNSIPAAWGSPPNNHNIAYVIVIFLLLYGLYGMLQNIWDYTTKLSWITSLGRLSLYVYLYHLACFRFGTRHNLIRLIIHGDGMGFRIMNGIWLVFWSIVPPLLIYWCVKKIKKSFFWDKSTINA